MAARPATAGDLSDLADLATQAIEEQTPIRGGAVWRLQAARSAPATESLATDLSDDRTAVIVGTIDDTIVGYGVASLEDLAGGDTLGVVTDLYTLPDARGVGVGEAVMNALIDWCREQGCFGVDSIALPGDRHTKNFFESFGLVARAIIVHRSLDPK